MARSSHPPLTIIVDTREQFPYTFPGLRAEHLPLTTPIADILSGKSAGLSDPAGGKSAGLSEPAGGVEIVTRKLPAGDYSIAGLEAVVAVERKELDDFVSTVIHDRERWIAEVRLLARMPHPLILIEATLRDILDRRYTAAVHPEALVGEIISLQVAWQIPVFMAGDRQAAQEFLGKWLMKVYQL